MDCREAQVILSTMADGASVPPDEIAELRAHCRKCRECASFATAVARLRKVKPPASPRGLAKRIATVVAAEMAEAAAREEPAAVEEVPAAEETVEEKHAVAPPVVETTEEEGIVLPWLSRERLWTVIAAVGTSAAVVLLAVVVSGQLSGRAALDQEAQEAISRSLYGGPTAGLATEGTDQAAQPPAAAPAEAPPYVAFNGKVYSPSTAAEEVNPSRLTTIGVVYTSFAGAEAPAALDAYSRQGDTSLVLRRSDGTYQVCSPVVRSHAGAVYQLTTGVDIPRYGTWPRLPADMPEPTESSGAPVFIGAGTDQLGVKIYARIGSDTSSGIAVAPGTASTDPAGGNPYWTWWVRLQ